MTELVCRGFHRGSGCDLPPTHTHTPTHVTGFPLNTNWLLCYIIIPAADCLNKAPTHRHCSSEYTGSPCPILYSLDSTDARSQERRCLKRDFKWNAPRGFIITVDTVNTHLSTNRTSRFKWRGDLSVLYPEVSNTTVHFSVFGEDMLLFSTSQNHLCTTPDPQRKGLPRSVWNIWSVSRPC